MASDHRMVKIIAGKGDDYNSKEILQAQPINTLNQRRHDIINE